MGLYCLPPKEYYKYINNLFQFIFLKKNCVNDQIQQRNAMLRSLISMAGKIPDGSMNRK